MSIQSGDRWEVKVVRERNGKKYYTRIGSAFCNRDGSIGVVLDANPVDGQLYISPPFERDEQQRGGGGGQRQNNNNGQRRQGQGSGQQQRRGGGPRRIQEDMEFPDERPARQSANDQGGFDDGGFDDGGFADE